MSERGTVLRFNNAEGHGVIRSEGGDDLFVHFTAIDVEGFKALSAGQSVNFERVVQPGPPDGRPREVDWYVRPTT